MKRLLSLTLILSFLLFGALETFAAAPTVQSRYIAYNGITSSGADLQFTRGNGDGRIVVIRTDNTWGPTDAILTTGGPIFADAGGDLTSAPQVGATGSYVIDVLPGTSSTFRKTTLTNLSAGTTYYVKVYEFNLYGSNWDFNNTTAVNNPRSFTTSANLSTPSASIIKIWSEGGLLSWTNDPLAVGYLLTIKQGATTIYDNLNINKPSTPVYEIMGLNATTTYTFELRSYDANFNLSTAATGNWTTLANPNLNPCPPTVYSPGHENIVGIGQTVTITATALNDQIGLVENTQTTVNNVTRTSFTDNGDGTYTIVYTVAAGHTDIPDANDLPLNIDLEDGNGVPFASPCTGTGNALNAPGIDANAPYVLTITPNPNDAAFDGSWGINSNIDFLVSFNEPVTVTGTPRIALANITPSGKYANYLSGSGTDQLIFRYTVAEGDQSNDLTINGGSSNGVLDLNGGTIEDLVGNDLTNLSLNRTGDNFQSANNIVIDGVRPYVSSIVRQSPTNSCVNNTSVTFRVTFSENIDPWTLDASDFTLTTTGGISGTIGTPSVVTPNTVFDVQVTSISGGPGTMQLDFTGWVNDAVTNNPNSSNVTFITGEQYDIDLVAPSATITTPANASCVNLTSLTQISGTCSDNGCGGVSQVEVALWVDNGGTVGSFDPGTDFYWDNSSSSWNSSSALWYTAETGTNLSTWTFNSGDAGWPTWTEGRIYVQTRTTDGASNQTTSGQGAHYFVYDNTAPTASITSPTYATCYTSSTLPSSIAGTASDGVGCGVSTVEVAIWRDINGNGSFDGSDGYYNSSAWTSTSPVWFTASGTTSWSLGMPSLPSDARYYVQTKVTDGAGNSATSSATGHYFAYDNTSLSAISDDNVCISTSFNKDFSTTASGGIGGSYTFTWEYFNGSWGAVTNGTPAGVNYTITTIGNTSTLNISGSISTAGTYQYRVRVTDHCGNDVIETFDLIVAGGPTISTLSDIYVPLGNSFSFSPTVLNGTTFQWYKDGSPISGATSSSYGSSSATYSDDGDYYLEASNACGTTTSNTAHLYVYPSTQASYIYMISRTNSSITLSWTRGDGNGVILTAKLGTTNTHTPTNGTSYTANAYFPSAPWLAGSGTSKVVYNGTGTSVTVTGLLPNKFYTFRLFEYNSTNYTYNTTTTTLNPRKLKTSAREIAYEEEVIAGKYGELSAIYPNPSTSGEIDFVYRSDFNGEALVQIISAEGVELYSNAINVYTGINDMSIIFGKDNKFSAGMYILRLTANGETLQQKFIYLP